MSGEMVEITVRIDPEQLGRLMIGRLIAPLLSAESDALTVETDMRPAIETVVFRDAMEWFIDHNRPDAKARRGVAVKQDGNGNVIAAYARFADDRLVELHAGDELVYTDGELSSVVVKKGKA